MIQSTLEQHTLQRWMARHSAILVLLGLATGAFAGLAMTGKVDADGHAALASHLNALLGAFWILGVAWSVPFLSFGAIGTRRLAFAVVGAQYANWAITALKAVWKVAGLDAGGDPKNGIIFGLLLAFVVAPSIAAASAWIFGLSARLKA